MDIYRFNIVYDMYLIESFSNYECDFEIPVYRTLLLYVCLSIYSCRKIFTFFLDRTRDQDVTTVTGNVVFSDLPDCCMSAGNVY